MKSRTEYVRKEYVKEVRRQTVTHKRFKRLVEQWIDLSIEHSLLGSARIGVISAGVGRRQRRQPRWREHPLARTR
jgi:hypothetical protein